MRFHDRSNLKLEPTLPQLNLTDHVGCDLDEDAVQQEPRDGLLGRSLDLD